MVFFFTALPCLHASICDQDWSHDDIDDHPSLCFVGAAGAGKKTTALFLKRQIEPCSERLQSISLPSGNAQVVCTDRSMELHASMFRSLEDLLWFQDHVIQLFPKRHLLIIHAPNMSTLPVWKWADHPSVWCWFVCKGLFHPRSFSGRVVRVPHWNATRSGPSASATVASIRQRKWEHLSDAFRTHSANVNHALQSWWHQPELCHRMWELELLSMDL